MVQPVEYPLAAVPLEKQDVSRPDGHKIRGFQVDFVSPVPEKGNHAAPRHHQWHLRPSPEQRRQALLHLVAVQHMPARAHGITPYFFSSSTRCSPMATLSLAAPVRPQVSPA